MFYIELDQKKYFKKKKIRKPEFIVDETLVNAGNEDVLPWMAIELSDKIIPGIRISIERLEACCKIIPSKFNYKIRKTQYNRLMVGLLQACRFLNIKSSTFCDIRNALQKNNSAHKRQVR